MDDPRIRPWHAGRTVGRTLYQGDGSDDLVGVMDTRELAALVVRAVNSHEALIAALEASIDWDNLTTDDFAAKWGPDLAQDGPEAMMYDVIAKARGEQPC
jgi:hypothetical protein